MATPSTLRPATTWLALLAAAALALVLLTGCPSAPAPDPEAPTVTATVPADGTTDVALDTPISVTFSAAMNRAATQGALVSAPAIDCAFDWNDAGTTLTCTPTTPLLPNTTYSVTITTEATDGGGVAVADDHTFSFTTDPGPDPDLAAPTVTATVPADGTTGIAVSTIISVTFSLPMNTAATEGAFASAPAIACSFAWNATDTTLTCTPDAPLTPDTAYTLSVGTDAESAAGTALAAAFDIVFTTAPAVIDLCTFGTSTFGACRFGP